MPTKRASIHSDSAPHSQSSPRVERDDESRGRKVHADRRHQHRRGQVAGVARADEHAVEDEHDRRGGLQRGDEPRAAHGELAHAGVVGEQRRPATVARSPRPRARTQQPDDDAPLDEPARRPRGHLPDRIAPRNRPTIACAAIASASSDNARNSSTCIAIWCAATSSSPMRDAMAVAVSSATISDGGAHHEAAPDGRVRPDAGGARSDRRALAANGAPDDRRGTRPRRRTARSRCPTPSRRCPRSSPYTRSQLEQRGSRCSPPPR